jgi:hypothetical protein
MANISEDRKQYLVGYKKEKIKRIPLDVKPEFYDAIKRAADKNGESVNGFIKRAIRTELLRSTKSPVSKS